MRGVLVDAGPLVALLDQNDWHHVASVAALRTLRDPLVTVWPAFTEAMYLLGSSWRGQKALWSRVETGALTLAPLDEGDAPRMRELMEMGLIRSGGQVNYAVSSVLRSSL